MWWGFLVDLLSGSALPLLHLLRGAPTVVMALLPLLGAAASAGLSLLRPVRGPGATAAALLLSLLRAGLSASQLMRAMGRVDPDVGAGLVVIPLFALMAMPGRPRGVLRAGLSAVLTVLSLAVACGYAVFTPPAAPPGPSGSGAGWYASLLGASAFACLDGGGGGLLGTGLRGGALALLPAVLPGAVTLLLAEEQAGFLLVVHGCLLVHSAMAHAAAARRALEGWAHVELPQRALMVWLGPTLATALAFGPERAGPAALAAVVAVPLLQAV